MNIALAALPWCAYMHTLLWAVVCARGQCSAQDLPPSDQRMEVLTE